ncbi:MAG: AMIN domain-containing protein [Armatimonadetes bacterium]|nr:AMIN domain-containing protein [Armatimonadota bacterium]
MIIKEKYKIYKIFTAFCLILIFISSLIFPSFSESFSLITNVSVKTFKDQVKLAVSGNRKFEYKVINMNDPNKAIILEIFPAQLEKNAKITTQLNFGNIEKIRSRQFSDKPDIVRIVIDLKEGVKYKVSFAHNKTTLNLALFNNIKLQNTLERNSIKNSTQTNISSKSTKPINSQTSNKVPLKSKAKTVASKIASNPIKPEVNPPKVITTLTKNSARVSISPTKSMNLPLSAENSLKDKNKTVSKIASKSIKPRLISSKIIAFTKPKKKKAGLVKEKLYNLNYDNIDLVYLLKDLAKKSNQNIVWDSEVKGSITISLTNVTLERALQVILNTTKFSFKRLGNIILISTPQKLALVDSDDLKPSGVEYIKVISLNYLKADDVVKALSNMNKKYKFSSDPKLNIVMIKAPLEYIKDMEKLVAQMDQPPAPLLSADFKTKLVKLKYAKASDLQSMLSRWYSNLQISPDNRLNAFIVSGGEEDLKKLEEFISKVDLPQKQVVMDVKIVDLTETGSKSLGVSWNSWGSLLTTTLTEVKHNGTAFQSGAAYTLPTYQDLPFQTFARSKFSIKLALNYLVSKGLAKVIATPQIATLSGKDANITVGQNYPITYTDPRAGGLQAQYIDMAVKLTIKPIITPDGYIMAEISPDISDLASSSNSTYPQTITRSAKTNILVKDGETIVLGGLYRKDKRTTKNKLPVLGDIPIFGEFFKSTADDTSKDELVIMITPKIVSQEL